MTTVSQISFKRLKSDIRLLQKEPIEYIDVIQDETDMFKWYFLIKGPKSSDYEGGYYLGLLLLNPEYPFKSPDFKMLTPSGRFDVDQKIFLHGINYCSNEWSSFFNIRTILMTFLCSMLDDEEQGISCIKTSKKNRIYYSENSIDFNKKNFPEIIKKFPNFLNKKYIDLNEK